MSGARRVGRYRVGERIGFGGVAEVFAATAEGAQGFAKQLVIKRLRDELAQHEEVVAAFRDEAELAQRLSHGNIVQVFDFGLDEDRPYIVMEFVDGCSLRDLIDGLRERSDEFPMAEAVYVVEEIADALSYAHRVSDDDGNRLGIVHRDVTPKNVLISCDGVVKLTDFGIAKVGNRDSETLPGVVKGTPLYLAPEQASGRPVDARTDVYALGLVLMDLLGERDEPALRVIATRATEPAPADRFKAADAMAVELAAWRAERKMRPRPQRLSNLVREMSGRAKTKQAVALDGALALDTHQENTRVHAIPVRPSRRNWGPIVIGAAAVSALVVVLALPPTDPEPVQQPTPGMTAAPPRKAAEPRPSIAEKEPDEQPAKQIVAEPESESPDAKTPVKRGRGTLKVNVLPWANVYVDGRLLGETPLEQPVRAGKHSVRLHNPDTGKTVTREVKVKSGKRATINSW